MYAYKIVFSSPLKFCNVYGVCSDLFPFIPNILYSFIET